MTPSEILELQKKINNQKRQITVMRLALETKNRELDALHFVWCDGACYSGVHRYNDEPLTEEIVLQAEYQALRLRSTYNGMRWKIENWPLIGSTQSDWHKKYIEALKKKIAYMQGRTSRSKSIARKLHQWRLVLHFNPPGWYKYLLRRKVVR